MKLMNQNEMVKNDQVLQKNENLPEETANINNSFCEDQVSEKENQDKAVNNDENILLLRNYVAEFEEELKQQTEHQNLKFKENPVGGLSDLHSGEQKLHILKIYECKVCEKTFTQKSNLTKHMSLHSGGKPFECHLCEKRFTQKITFDRHMITHSGGKPFECHLCEKPFTQKTTFDRHMITHSGEKPFVCHICEKRFTRKDHLKRHMLIHSGEKSHNCSICNRAFNRKTNLTRHILTHG